MEARPMRWQNPVPFRLEPTDDSESFASFPEGVTGLPVGQHKGAFGVQRKHHVHEGVDLYVPAHTPIVAVENSVVVSVQPFTGKIAGSPWWRDTWAVLVEGETGVVVYGEMTVADGVSVGRELMQGDLVGFITPVLLVDKGRPLSMLHLELHYHGTTTAPEWPVNGRRPASLRDPTTYLKDAITRRL